MSRVLVGAFALAAILGAVILADRYGGDFLRRSEAPRETRVTALVGGEKLAFLANPRVVAHLQEAHGIVLDARKAGSIEMVMGPPGEGIDALWPSNEIAVELFLAHGGRVVGDTLIFNSPLVFYTWRPVLDALQDAGIAQALGNSAHAVDTAALIQLVLSGRAWSEIGVEGLYGPVTVQSTNPSKSNSGNMFAGLVANMLAGGRVADVAAIEAHSAEITALFEALGHMERSSGDIFRKYLDMGLGAKPLIVGYENQLVEVYIAEERYRDFIEREVTVLYPKPTVWAPHPLIALNEKGSRLAAALLDPAIQEIAWAEHGFRSGLTAGAEAPQIAALPGIPERIESVIGLPSPAAMAQIIALIDPMPGD